MRVAGGEGARIIRTLQGLPCWHYTGRVQLDAERHKVKRNHFAFPQAVCPFGFRPVVRKVHNQHVLRWENPTL